MRFFKKNNYFCRDLKPYSKLAIQVESERDKSM